MDKINWLTRESQMLVILIQFTTVLRSSINAAPFPGQIQRGSDGSSSGSNPSEGA
jgi:hypothetical protein